MNGLKRDHLLTRGPAPKPLFQP